MRLTNTLHGTWLLAASLVQGTPAGNKGTNATWGDLVARLTQQSPGEKVPGISTMWHCKGTGTNDIATLDYVDMSPKVLSKNKPVNVNVSASLNQAIVDGAIVELSVKYSIIPIKIISRKDPLCTLIKEIGIECPFSPGPIGFEQEIMVPNRFIPPGMYHIHVNAYTETGELITCLNIDQKFK